MVTHILENSNFRLTVGSDHGEISDRSKAEHDWRIVFGGFFCLFVFLGQIINLGNISTCNQRIIA